MGSCLVRSVFSVLTFHFSNFLFCYLLAFLSFLSPSHGILATHSNTFSLLFSPYTLPTLFLPNHTRIPQTAALQIIPSALFASLLWYLRRNFQYFCFFKSIAVEVDRRGLAHSHSGNHFSRA